MWQTELPLLSNDRYLPSSLPVSNGVHHQCEEFPCRPSCVDSVLSLPDVVREFHEKATGGVKRGPLKSPQSPIPDIGTVDVEPAAAFCVNSFREIWQNVISSQSKNLLSEKKKRTCLRQETLTLPPLGYEQLKYSYFCILWAHYSKYTIWVWGNVMGISMKHKLQAFNNFYQIVFLLSKNIAN